MATGWKHAAELDLSGAEVAQRAGLTATRYGHYLEDFWASDLATLVRVYRVLGLRPDIPLALDQAVPGSDALLAKHRTVVAYLDVLDASSLDLASPVARAITATVRLRSLTPASMESSGAHMLARVPVIVLRSYERRRHQAGDPGPWPCPTKTVHGGASTHSRAASWRRSHCYSCR